MRFTRSLHRLVAVPALTAALLVGASTPSFAAGLLTHATHSGNCGKYSSQSHKTPHASWTKTCPSKPHHPTHPVHPMSPTTNASGNGSAPGQHVRTTTPGWAKNRK